VRIFCPRTKLDEVGAYIVEPIVYMELWIGATFTDPARAVMLKISDASVTIVIERGKRGKRGKRGEDDMEKLRQIILWRDGSTLGQ